MVNNNAKYYSRATQIGKGRELCCTVCGNHTGAHGPSLKVMVKCSRTSDMVDTGQFEVQKSDFRHCRKTGPARPKAEGPVTSSGNRDMISRSIERGKQI